MQIVKKITLFLVLIFIFSHIFISTSFASSSYVLPYPSVMPGGLSYKVHVVWEKLLHYWYWGSFGQFTYNLKESDKYLIEAKTLFEYQQYLLGVRALEKSNTYWVQTYPQLKKARSEGKDISQKRQILYEAALKHSEVLEKMEEETPKDFIWSPEKNPSSQLHIHQLIQQALQERQKYL